MRCRNAPNPAAENRAMAEALGVDVRRLYAVVFTIGTVLGTTA